MEATFMKVNKKSIFQNFIGLTHIFTRLERLLTISDRGRIAGV